ncbi:MAG TPA: DUF5602 domain-containing protein [Fimbriimonadaceae bacterium]|nr:DUF5602 domain-containing protein [Fimbriimonadaceae bacterium]
MVITAALVGMTMANGIAKGPEVKLGNGSAYAWVRMRDGRAEGIGISMTKGSLEGLPKSDKIDTAFETVLVLPKEAKGMPFDHIGIDWNPAGHVPIGIYNTPHFDFHFYTVTAKERDVMTHENNGIAKFHNKPADGFIPEGFFMAPESEVPRMGAHWIHPKSPELNGGKFTATMIYGSYDGKVTFLEPMVAYSFLKEGKSVREPIAQPAQVAWTGKNFPTEFSLSHDSGTIMIELGKATKR